MIADGRQADYLWRIDNLRRTGTAIKFLSLDPLLGRLGKLNLNNVDWVIAEEESSLAVRHMDPPWVKRF